MRPLFGPSPYPSRRLARDAFGVVATSGARLERQQRRESAFARDPAQIGQRVVGQLQALAPMHEVVARLHLARVKDLIEAWRERRALDLGNQLLHAPIKFRQWLKR